VTIGHNKSCATSGYKNSLAGQVDIYYWPKETSPGYIYSHILPLPLPWRWEKSSLKIKKWEE